MLVAPTGSGFIHMTGGSVDAAARVVNLMSGDVTGALGIANGGTGLSTIGGAGTALVSTGTAPAWVVAGPDVALTATTWTVVGLQAKALPALSAGYLNYTGAAWALTALPAALPPNGAAGGDLAGSYPNPSVGGLLTKVLPALATGYLNYTGSAWAISTLPPLSPITVSPVQFANSVAATFGQLSTSATPGGDFTIISEVSTNAIGTPGNIVLQVPIETGTGVAGYTFVRRGTANVLAVGVQTLTGLAGAIWCLAPGGLQTPSNSNWVISIAPAGGVTYVNTSGIFQFIQNGATVFATWTGNGLALYNGDTSFGGGTKIFALPRASTQPSAAATSGVFLWSSSTDALGVSAAGGVGGGPGAPWAWSNSALAVTTGTVTLSSAQQQAPTQVVTGTLVGNVTIVVPNASGDYLFDLSAVVFGAFTISFQSGTKVSAAVAAADITTKRQTARVACYGTNTLSMSV